MLEIIAKAASEHAVLDKLSRGANGIEWQLIITGNVNVGNLHLPIYNVHTRLQNGDDICLDKAYNDYLGIQTSDYISDSHNSYVYLIEALELGNWLGEMQNIRVNIVCHYYYGEIVQDKKAFASWLKELFYEYPNCNILVENSCALNKNVRLRNMYLPDVVPIFVETLRGELGEKYANRLGSVLDVCHMLSSYRVVKTIFDLEGLSDKVMNLEDYLINYFKSYSNTCGTVHFNNSTNLGINPLNHGTVFDVNNEIDMSLFNMLMHLYLKYTPNARLVLEVREDDVDIAYNFENLCSLIREWEIVNGI